MTLAEYIEAGHKTMEELSALSGISYQTIKKARRGYKIAKYEVAKAISDATRQSPEKEPMVTIDELCD